ncbi:MAG: cytochrome c biogenesis protein ResB, partial [Campylobacter lanienae]
MGIIHKLFFSMGSAVVFFLIFAFASGAATIIESVYNTQTAWALVYGAGWFALIQLILGVNLVYNIYEYKLFQLKKLPAFIFHLSFLFILVGAGITRYFGFEGHMSIRENDSSNEIRTMQSYIQMISSDGNNTYTVSEPKYISSTIGNDFNLRLNIHDKLATLKYKDFTPNATPAWIDSPNGEAILELMFSDESNSESVTMKLGDKFEVGDMSFSFGAKPTKSKYIQIYIKDSKFYIKTNQDISYMVMSDMSKGELPKDEEVEFAGLRLYSIGGVNFAPRTMKVSAIKGAKKAGENVVGADTIIATLSYNNDSKDVVIMSNYPPEAVEVGGQKFYVAWSPMAITLPFSIYLKDFELARYPGSNSPMSYSSDVVVEDGDFKMDYRIYMNNVLDYKGYRFFQSSYDADEGGTI